MSEQIAYHFTGHVLRDGSPIPAVGEWLVHHGQLELCRSGLHWSIEPFDALQYAPGPLLHKVEYRGKIIKGEDKGVSSKRCILATIDATDLLRSFGRQCALDVIHLWDAPPVVIEYLKTGNEKLRAAARAAARDAAWAAARDAAAWDAAWDAARAAAWDAAAWDAAAWDAARAAARDAAWAAQRKRFNQIVFDAFAEVSNA